MVSSSCLEAAWRVAPALRSLALAIAVGLLPVLLPCDAAGPARAVPRIREWDELRTSELQPLRIATPATKVATESGALGLGQVTFFEKAWLRIEGATADDSLLSSNFEFQKLDYPHEWAARVLRQGAVRLHVGPCECILSGLAVYEKDDKTVWLRFQFEDCRDCDSTATRAAVIMPIAVATDVAHDSNLYAWMCALSDIAACGEAPEVRTTSTTTKTTTTRTSSTPRPHCTFEGDLRVKAIQRELGPGRCLADQRDGKIRTHTSRSLQSCHITCQLTYTSLAADYSDLQDIREHIFDINHHTRVCKGYAYNSKTQECSVYMGANSVFDYTDHAEGWRCFGNVHVDNSSFSYHSSFGEDCTTLPSTATATTSTVTMTSTTTTTTRPVVPLTLKWLFSAQAEEGSVYGFPGEARFSSRKTEATSLQLQSSCYWAIDYYILNTPLLVAGASWHKLLKLTASYGDAVAWSPALESGQDGSCLASITVDRLPVEADTAGNGRTRSLTPFGQGALSWLIPWGVGVLATVAILAAKSMYYPKGIEPYTLMESAELGSVACVALLAGFLAIFAAFWLVQFVAWMFGRIAVKRFAYGLSPALFCAAPLLSSYALPVSVTMGSVAVVSWLWQKDEPASHEILLSKQELHISYDPLSGEMSSFIA